MRPGGELKSRVLEELAELVRRESGIVLVAEQLRALETAAARAAPGLRLDEVLSLAADPDRGRETIDRLIDEVTVQETYFFRSQGELEAIDWHDLRTMARARGGETVRVWVPACATGEEAYTLAMLAARAFELPSPPVSILATDISTAALAAARRGVYGPRSSRQVPAEDRERWLVPESAGLRVGDKLRSLVRFERHNLVADPAPPRGEEPFDLIVCRNVLIYFDGDTVERVIASLEAGLWNEGSLVLGAADRLSGSVRRLGRMVSAAAGRRSMPARLPHRPLGRKREASAMADPLDRDTHFLTGLDALEKGDAAAAVHELRRALYIDPSFGLAAFHLGRAHDQLGDASAARRAYRQARRARP